MPETSSPIIEPTASSGRGGTPGMPPARETTSGRLTTENSARISEVFIPCVRAAYRSANGSRRGCRGTTCEGGCAPDPGGWEAAVRRGGGGPVVLPVDTATRSDDEADDEGGRGGQALAGSTKVPVGGSA